MFLIFKRTASIVLRNCLGGPDSSAAVSCFCLSSRAASTFDQRSSMRFTPAWRCGVFLSSLLRFRDNSRTLIRDTSFVAKSSSFTYSEIACQETDSPTVDRVLLRYNDTNCENCDTCSGLSLLYWSSTTGSMEINPLIQHALVKHRIWPDYNQYIKTLFQSGNQFSEEWIHASRHRNCLPRGRLDVPERIKDIHLITAHCGFLRASNFTGGSFVSMGQIGWDQGFYISQMNTWTRIPVAKFSKLNLKSSQMTDSPYITPAVTSFHTRCQVHPG